MTEKIIQKILCMLLFWFLAILCGMVAYELCFVILIPLYFIFPDVLRLCCIISGICGFFVLPYVFYKHVYLKEMKDNVN